MDECFKYFLENFGPQFNKVQPLPSDIEKFRGKLPDKLLEYWQDHGWGGFHSGLFWLVNPSDYTEVVDAWLSNNGIEGRDSYFAIARTAFGRVFLWNKSSGQTATISGLFSEIITTPPNRSVLAGDEVSAVEAFMATKEPDALDIEDEKEKKIFKRAVEKLGALKADEMYGFEPALVIGGAPKLDNLVKVKVIEHLILLQQFGEIEILHMDVSRHL
jgi:hypothetical protein